MKITKSELRKLIKEAIMFSNPIPFTKDDCNHYIRELNKHLKEIKFLMWQATEKGKDATLKATGHMSEANNQLALAIEEFENVAKTLH